MRALLTRSRRLLASTLGVLLALVSLGAAQAQDSAAGLKPLAMNVGFTKHAFLNVDRNDAEASFKALLVNVGRGNGYNITSKIHVFEDGPGLEAEVKSGLINMVVIDSWRFLAMDVRSMVTPFFVTSDQGKVGKKYVLLTRRGSNLNTLADLRGKEVLEIEATVTVLGHPWLETFLLENHFGTGAKFFRNVQRVGKPSTAILPVFFGQKDACLVDEPGFEIMKELNPKIGQVLQVVMISEPFVEGMICLKNSGWPAPEYKQDLIRALAELHTAPAGQQILNLFKVGRMVPFQESQLDAVRKLRAAYDRLQSQSR